jgi:hypothetical protein
MYTLESAAVSDPWQKRTNLPAPAIDQGLGAGVVEFREAIGSGSQRYYRMAHPAY